MNTTVAALAEGRATGGPEMEKLTPGLFGELERALGWNNIDMTIGGKSPNGSLVSSPSSPLGGSGDDTSEGKIVWFHELGEPKEREYLIEKIGVKGYPIVAFGAGGAAKSFALLAAGISIASASGVEKWLGLQVLEHGHVLYLDFELDVDEQHRRVRDLCAGMGVLVPKRLAYLSGVGLPTEEAFARALAFAEEHEAKAVIIDSMGLAMQGDMEKGKEVLAFHGRYINPLRRAGVTPFFVDHEGKLQSGEKHKDISPFGSAYKAWASRSVLQFVFEEYREETSELDIRVRQTKTNFGPKLDPIGVRFTFGDKNVSMGTYDLPDEELLEEESRPVKERILVALRLEGATNKQLQQITGATEGTVRNKLSELRSDGVITDDGKRPATYNLVSSSPRTRGDDDTSPPPVDGEANPAERALSDDLGPGESATVAELRSKRRERENPSVTDAATVVGGKVVHVHGPHRHGAVYVGNAWRPRGGSGSALEQAEFGNPYRVDKPGKPRDGDLPTVLENFYRWLMDKIEADAASMARLRAHAGKTLACWCVGKNGCPDVLLPDGPLWCHAQIILREANRLAAEEAEQKPRAKRLTTPEEAMRIQRLVSQGMKPELARREVLGVEA